MSSNPVIAQWWFHLPNFVLAALMYTLLGRLALGFFFDPQSQNYIWRFFVRVTDPVVRTVSYVTPLSVPPVVVLLFAFVWLLVARIAFLTLVANLGALPTAGVSGS